MNAYQVIFAEKGNYPLWSLGSTTLFSHQTQLTKEGGGDAVQEGLQDKKGAEASRRL